MSSGGKYGDLIKKAREPENQKGSQRDDQKGGKPDNQKPEVALVEQDVNLCVKVPISLRRHWSAEAKRTGVTMTEVIIEALKARFGEPD